MNLKLKDRIKNFVRLISLTIIFCISAISFLVTSLGNREMGIGYGITAGLILGGIIYYLMLHKFPLGMLSFVIYSSILFVLLYITSNFLSQYSFVFLFIDVLISSELTNIIYKKVFIAKKTAVK